MKLYITRHGKTQWNIEGKFQGALDSPLVASGIEDAKALHHYLLNEHFDYVYTSPLGRAKTTCELIFKDRGIKIQEDARLMEMNFGVFEGMKTQDIFKQYEELYDNLWNHPEKFTRCPNHGESFMEVRARIESFIHDISKLPSNSKIFIVTHGMYFVCLLAYFKGYELKDYPKINRYIVRGCSLTIVDIDKDTYQVECVGDDHYLKKEAQDTFLIKQKDVA